VLKVRDMLEKFFVDGGFEIPENYTHEEYKEYLRFLAVLEYSGIKHSEDFKNGKFIIRRQS